MPYAEDIICTIGPKSWDPEVLVKLMKAPGDRPVQGRGSDDDDDGGGCDGGGGGHSELLTSKPAVAVIHTAHESGMNSVYS